MRIAISGPTTLTNREKEQVCTDFERRISAGDIVYSGAAYGVDTVGAKAAKPSGCELILVAPKDLWHNESLRKIADRIIDVRGTYMDRNDRLADHAECLIAYPPTALEEIRSGTWSTVRRFRKRGKPVVIVPLDSL